MKKHSLLLLFLVFLHPLCNFASSENFEAGLFSTMRSFSGKNAGNAKNSLWFDFVFLKNFTSGENNSYQIGFELAPSYEMKNEKDSMSHLQGGINAGYKKNLFSQFDLIFRLHGGYIQAKLKSSSEKENLSYGGISLGTSYGISRQISAQFHYGIYANFFGGGIVWTQNMSLGLGINF